MLYHVEASHYCFWYWGNYWEFWSQTFLRLLTLVLFRPTPSTLSWNLCTLPLQSQKKRQHYYQLPNIEFSQYKNCFINRCLFKFRWSYFVCFVLLYFCNILYFLSLLRLIHLSLCNSVRLTCWIKRLLDFTSICSRQQIGSRTDMWR